MPSTIHARPVPSAGRVASPTQPGPEIIQRHTQFVRQHLGRGKPHQWGMREVQSISHDEVQMWVSALAESKSASVTIRAEGILRALLVRSKADRCIHDNPCDGVELPRRRRKEHVYLTVGQLLALADASGWRRPIVFTLGLCGLRWGELVGLQVGDVDLDRQRIHVRRSATEVSHEIVVDVPKTGEGWTVIFPRLLRSCLEEACRGWCLRAPAPVSQSVAFCLYSQFAHSVCQATGRGDTIIL